MSIEKVYVVRIVFDAGWEDEEKVYICPNLEFALDYIKHSLMTDFGLNLAVDSLIDELKKKGRCYLNCGQTSYITITELPMEETKDEETNIDRNDVVRVALTKGIKDSFCEVSAEYDDKNQIASLELYGDTISFSTKNMTYADIVYFAEKHIVEMVMRGDES